MRYFPILFIMMAFSMQGCLIRNGGSSLSQAQDAQSDEKDNKFFVQSRMELFNRLSKLRKFGPVFDLNTIQRQSYIPWAFIDRYRYAKADHIGGYTMADNDNDNYNYRPPENPVLFQVGLAKKEKDLIDRPHNHIMVYFTLDALLHMTSDQCGWSERYYVIDEKDGRTGGFETEGLYFVRKEDSLTLFLAHKYDAQGMRQKQNSITLNTASDTGGTASSHIYFWEGVDGKLRIATREFILSDRNTPLIRKFTYMTVDEKCAQVEKNSTRNYHLLREKDR